MDQDSKRRIIFLIQIAVFYCLAMLIGWSTSLVPVRLHNSAGINVAVCTFLWGFFCMFGAGGVAFGVPALIFWLTKKRPYRD
jgi:hypothetical protein